MRYAKSVCNGAENIAISLTTLEMQYKPPAVTYAWALEQRDATSN